MAEQPSEDREKNQEKAQVAVREKATVRRFLPWVIGGLILVALIALAVTSHYRANAANSGGDSAGASGAVGGEASASGTGVPGQTTSQGGTSPVSPMPIGPSTGTFSAGAASTTGADSTRDPGTMETATGSSAAGSAGTAGGIGTAGGG